jgi:hypothetical protein
MFIWKTLCPNLTNKLCAYSKQVNKRKWNIEAVARAICYEECTCYINLYDQLTKFKRTHLNPIAQLACHSAMKFLNQ